MAWVVLFVAGLLEIGWAIGLKYTDGFTRLWPSIGTVGAMAISFLLLSHSLKTIPVVTGYAVWTAIGAVGTVVAGMAFFSEPRGIGRIVCILMVVIGVIGLKIISSH